MSLSALEKACKRLHLPEQVLFLFRAVLKPQARIAHSGLLEERVSEDASDQYRFLISC